MASSGKKGKSEPSLSIADQLLKDPKIGFGTVTHTETARWKARVILFERMRGLRSGDLGKLHSETLLLYKALYELGRASNQTSPANVPILVIREATLDGGELTRALQVVNWSALSEAADYFNEAKILANAIWQWANSIHMAAAWFLDAVVINLLAWRLQPAGGKLIWTYPGTYMELQHNHSVGGGDMRTVHGWGNLDRLVPVPVVRPYNPSTQTREQHLSDLIETLESYYEEQEEHFKKSGFLKTIVKKKASGTTPWAHFDWFIKYQMDDWTSDQIASMKRGKVIGGDTVAKAVSSVADLIDVTLRPRDTINPA